MKTVLSKEELSAEINQEGRWEEFYQKGDSRGNGKNAYMQEYHKKRRLAFQAEFNRQYNK